MKKAALLLLLVVALLALSVAPSYAWHRWHGSVFVGVGPWWAPPYPYWWYPPPYYAYPPTVVVEEPPVYVQQQPAPPPAPPAPPGDWYYCSSANAYYPNVQTCPEAWVKVPARPQ